MPELAKPLGCKAYGSIPHLLGSKRGDSDHGVGEGQHRICTERVRDSHDRVIVQVKLDGANVAVAKVHGVICPLTRSGYLAGTSKYEHHHLFADYVRDRLLLFSQLLHDDEWISGEWLALAHGTRYDLHHCSPFVAFDLFERLGGKRVQASHERLRERSGALTLAPTIHVGGALSIAEAMRRVNARLYGELDDPEGAVWRVERDGKVDFMAKYVRPEKANGCYLPEVSGGEPVWNWRRGDA